MKLLDGAYMSLTTAQDKYRKQIAEAQHRVAEIIGDRWPDKMRLSNLEPRFDCRACGGRGVRGRT